MLNRVTLAFSRRIADFADDRFASIFVRDTCGTMLNGMRQPATIFALLISSDGRTSGISRQPGVIVGVNG